MDVSRMPFIEGLVAIMTSPSLPRLTLVLGGARSGKSRYAEELLAGVSPPWIYVATAEALDEEMRERIAHHRARRDPRWRTVDAPRDLTGALLGLDTAGQPVLVDCLTLWLSNTMLADQDVEAACETLADVLARVPGPLVVVSNEVGFGIVPDTPLGRRFRDAQGWLNQAVARVAERVVLVAAGLPLVLK